MADKIKSPVVLLLSVLILVSLSIAGSGFYLLQKERAKALSLQDELEQAKTRQGVVEARLEDSKKTVSELDTKLQEAKFEIDKINGELKQEKAAKQEVLSQAGQLKRDLDTQKSLVVGLDEKLKAAQKDVEKAKGELKGLISEKAELEKKLKALEDIKIQAQAAQEQQGVELGKVVVTPEANLSAGQIISPAGQKAVAGLPIAQAAEEKKPVKNIAVAASEGKVMVVNKDYNFAVVNLGSKNGIILGNIFSVYHNNKYIGDIKVEKVHDAMAAAGFIASDIKDKINENDRVVLKTG